MTASVVFVHGIRTSASMWRAQRVALDEAGIPSVAVDLPGHGSRVADRFTLETAMSAIDAGVGQVSGSGPVILCGLSLGGYLALHYAGGRGVDRVDGVVAASCGTRPRALPLGAYRTVAGAIGRLPDRGARINQFMVDHFVPMPGREDVTSGGVALEAMGPTLRAMAQVRPLESIARLRVPLLLVNGTLDHFRLEERLYLATARARPGLPPEWSQLVHVSGATHMVSLVRPEEFNRILVGSVMAAGRRGW